MGGKMRQGRVIAEVVARYIHKGQAYYEPFCGALGAAIKTVPVCLAAGASRIVLSDVSEITMWSMLRNGWQPPDRVSEKMHADYKRRQPPDDPLTAFIGFGCSFGGWYFAVYARGGGYNFALASKKSCLSKIEVVDRPRVVIRRSDYRRVHPKNAVMYLDPPYVAPGRPKVHSHTGNFIIEEFWDYARRMVVNRNTVIISGFEAPTDFHAIHSWGNTVSQHYSKDEMARGTDERLFMHRSQL